MKKQYKILSLILSVLFCSFIVGVNKSVFAGSCGAQVCAKNNLISDVYSIAPSVACGNHDNSYGTTLFSVGFNWGKDCREYSGQCSMTGLWRCNKAGAACPTSWNIDGWSIDYLPGESDDKYDVYRVSVLTNSGTQGAENKMKRKKTKVTVKSFAQCTDGTSLNNGDYMDRQKIDRSTSAKVKRLSVTDLNSKLEADSAFVVQSFSGWENHSECALDSRCEIDNVKEDTHVIALYNCGSEACNPDEESCDSTDEPGPADPGDSGGSQDTPSGVAEHEVSVNLWDRDTGEFLGNWIYQTFNETGENGLVNIEVSAPCLPPSNMFDYDFSIADSPIFGTCDQPVPFSFAGSYTINAFYRRKFRVSIFTIDQFTGEILKQDQVIVYRNDPLTVGAYVPAGYSIKEWGSPCSGWDGYSCPLGPITDNMSVVVYVRKKADLIGTAYDDFEKEEIRINGKLCQTGDYSIWQGESASVNRMKFGCDISILNSGYTWKYWDSEQKLCGYETGYLCWTPRLINNEWVYGHFEKNVFNARIIASGATNAKVSVSGDGYTRVSESAVGYADNCTFGCNIRFDNYLKRVSGSGATNYHVRRTSSNLTTTTRGIQNKDFGAKKGGDTTSGQNVQQDDVVLYPGMYICEELTFDSAYNEKNRVLKLCVYARGNAQPDDPANLDTPEDDPGNGKLNGDNAFINIKVRNRDVARWAKYQRSVYGKPGDTLAYRSSYNPVLQYAYHVQLTPGILERVLIDGGNPVTGMGQKVGVLFNQKISPAWNNGFSIYKRDVRSESLISNNKYAVGLFDKQSPAANNVKVLPEDAGSQITETAITNRVNTVKTTPSQVTFASDYGNVITKPKQSIAFATIPYNFIINTSITSPNPDEKQPDGTPKKPFFAGEEGSINYRVSVDNKTNQYTTDGSPNHAYATNAKNTRNKLIIYYPARVAKKGGGLMIGNIDATVCSSYYGYSGTDNSYCSEIDGGITSLTPGAHDSMKKFFVEDLPAGSEICFASAAFPATSGADTNWNDLNYDGRWRVSESKCYKIAKRPSVQVWGGNVYSGGKISATRAIKRNLYGYTGFSTLNPQGYFVFGSWGEHGVVSRGEVSGFASGATLGYGGNDNGTLSPNPYIDNKPSRPANPGGSNEINFCKQSVLTFANSNCLSGTASGAGGKDASEGVPLDVESIKSLMDNAGSVREINGSIVIGEAAGNGGEDDGVLLYKGNSNIEVKGGYTARNTYKIVSAPNINLTGNISLIYGESFSNFRQIPKVVIHATDTIYIGCNVTHIEAVLMANRVVSCNNIDSNNSGGFASQLSRRINDKQNSNQLYIFGAVLAGRLYVNRTYGAGNGANSVVPAEIIDFDPSLYMWGGIAGGSSGQGDGNGNMEVTYIKELAPRY